MSIGVEGKFADETSTLDGVRYMPSLGITSQAVRAADVAMLPHPEELITELCYEDSKPLLIIDIDNWQLSLARYIKGGTRNQIAAIRTALGWTIFGRLPGKP